MLSNNVSGSEPFQLQGISLCNEAEGKADTGATLMSSKPRVGCLLPNGHIKLSSHVVQGIQKPRKVMAEMLGPAKMGSVQEAKEEGWRCIVSPLLKALRALGHA